MIPLDAPAKLTKSGAVFTMWVPTGSPHFEKYPYFFCQVGIDFQRNEPVSIYRYMNMFKAVYPSFNHRKITMLLKGIQLKITGGTGSKPGHFQTLTETAYPFKKNSKQIESKLKANEKQESLFGAASDHKIESKLKANSKQIQSKHENSKQSSLFPSSLDLVIESPISVISNKCISTRNKEKHIPSGICKKKIGSDPVEVDQIFEEIWKTYPGYFDTIRDKRVPDRSKQKARQQFQRNVKQDPSALVRIPRVIASLNGDEYYPQLSRYLKVQKSHREKLTRVWIDDEAELNPEPINQQIPCDTCQGDGLDPETGNSACPTCDGNGYLAEETNP